ncbi:hypothetical protein FOI67_17405, partial [Geobacillus sp. LEMMJ02]
MPSITAVVPRYIYLPIFTASLHSHAYLSELSTGRIDGLKGAPAMKPMSLLVACGIVISVALSAPAHAD